MRVKIQESRIKIRAIGYLPVAFLLYYSINPVAYHMANQTTPQTPKFILKKLSAIYIWMFTLQILFVTAAFTLTGQRGGENDSIYNSAMYVIPVMAIIYFFISLFLFKKQIVSAQNKETLIEKLMIYQVAPIVRITLLAGTSLYAIFIFWETGDLYFLITPFIIMIYFLTIRPTKEKIANALNLSYNDKLLFDSSDPLK